jgi:5'-3' exonuclease
MLKTYISTPSVVKSHVVIELVSNHNREGFECFDSFSIQDINPDNKPGQPKFKVLLSALYLEEENIPHVNVGEFEKSFSELIPYLLKQRKGNAKLILSILTSVKINYKYLTSIILVSTRFDNDLDIRVGLYSKEGSKKYQDLLSAISEIKAWSKLKANLPEAYKEGLLSYEQNFIAERSFNTKRDLSGKRVIIIDTHNFFYRNYYGMPDMRSPSGQATNVIKALMTYISSLIKGNPDYIVFASEDPAGVKNGVRYAMYDQYKGNRDKTPDDLISQIKIANKLLEKMGFPVVYEEGFEADDIIGSYSEYFSSLGAVVTIHTSDKDMYQLINDRVRIWNPMKDIFIGLEECREKFLVEPNKVVYALALAGDTSDNVPGVKGVGPKKASALIEQFGDIENIYRHIDDISGAVQKNLIECKEEAFISLRLVKIYTFLAQEANIRELCFPNYNVFSLVEEELENLKITV